MANNRYREIVEEIETGNLQKDLWLQAWEKSFGNRSKATSIYISLRADQLYKENTAFYKRAARSTLSALDVRNHRTRKILTISCVILVIALFFAIQPALQRRASEQQRVLVERVLNADIKGKPERDLFEKVGRPDAV